MLVRCLLTWSMPVLFGADPVHRIRAWFSWLSWNFLMKTICQDIPATLAVLGGGSYNSFSDGFDLLPSLLNGEPWPRFLNSKNKGWSKRRRKNILQISANISLCPKMAPCFLGRKSCSLITMNQMEPSTLYDLVIHSSSLFLHHDHDCQGALFVHLIIAKAHIKLTGWQKAT